MRAPSPEAFTQTLADLSPPALVAFVAALWEARGWETRVDAAERTSRIVCTRDGEVTTVLVLGREPVGRRVRRAVGTWVGRETTPRVSESRAGTDVDVVVSLGTDTRASSFASHCDARVHDSRALYDFALYGLDRDEADALFRRHLGIGIAVRRDSPVDRTARRTDGRWWSLPLSGRGPDALVTVLVVLALVVAGLTVGFGPDRSVTLGALDNPGPSVPTPVQRQANPGSLGTDTSSQATGTESPMEVVLAPGLASRGLVRPDTLARAHATEIDGRSYVWRVSYTERQGESVTRADAVHRIRDARTLRVDVETTGTLATTPGQFIPRPAYADGDQRYVRFQGQILQRQLASRDHYAGHAETAFFGLLRANETDVDGWVVDGAVRYRVSLEGSPDPDRRQFRAVAFISPAGVVHHFAAWWIDRETNVTVSVRSSYEFVDDPNVSRPEWVRPVTDLSTNTTTESPTPTRSSPSETATATTPSPTATATATPTGTEVA